VMLLWAPLALSTPHTVIVVPAGTASTTSNKAPRMGSLGRDRLAWQVTIFMGSQSAMAYIVMGWLAPILRERGLESAAAGYVVATAIVSQLVTSLVTPSIAARCKDQRAFAVGVAALVSVSLLALIFAPLGGRWIWAVLLGCALGSGFALALSLIVMRSGNAHVTAQLSAMAQGWGYALAAFGPLLVGLLRGWTGGFESAAALIVVVAAAMGWSGWGAGRKMLVREGGG
ncbi:MAG: cyanate transporter, partial [Polaromonas sp.]